MANDDPNFAYTETLIKFARRNKAAPPFPSLWNKMAAEVKTMTLKLLTKTNRGRYKITNELCKVPGVKNIVVDLEENKMTVSGNYEQEKLLTKVSKFKKLIQVWPADPPPPPAEGDVSMPWIIELKVALHCRGCQRRVLAALCELRGVEKVDTDMERQRVTVTGHVDPHSLLTKIAKTKKRAEVASMTRVPPEVPPES